MSSFSPDSLLLPHRVWKVKFVGEIWLCMLWRTYLVGRVPRGWQAEWCTSSRCRGAENSMVLFLQVGLGVADSLFFPGESVDDCGGGYSESIAEICEELQNGLTPLLIVTPNGRDESGANRDCYLLNPATRAPVHCSMFRFLGGPLCCLSYCSGGPGPPLS